MPVSSTGPRPGRLAGCVASFVLALAGCTGVPTVQPPMTCVPPPHEILGHIDSRLLAVQLSEGLCPPVDEIRIDVAPTFLVVPDPVDVHSYHPQHLGRAFGEIFRTAIFQRCNVPIRQMELSKDFSLTQQGITALTRDFRDVRNGHFYARDAIITTYSLFPSRIVFVARRLDIAEAAIVAMSTREVSWSCEKGLVGPPTISTTIN